jgi:hypothetical protein
MKEKEQLDFSKPYVVYKNRGCIWGFLSVVCAMPFTFGLASLLFPVISLMPWWANLIVTLVSVGLWILFIRLCARHPDSETPVLIVSLEGIQCCRDTVFVKPCMIDWKDFVNAEVRTTSPGMVEHLDLVVRDPEHDHKIRTLTVGLDDTLRAPEQVRQVILAYRSRARKEEPGNP